MTGTDPSEEVCLGFFVWMWACLGGVILLEEIWGLLEEFRVILEGLRVLLEDWAELADFNWRLYEISGEKASRELLLEEILGY